MNPIVAPAGRSVNRAAAKRPWILAPAATPTRACRSRRARAHYIRRKGTPTLPWKDYPMPTTYDDLPYTPNAFAQSHPDRLATIATLLGLEAPRVDRARVLELGCGAGGNLIPMAEGLPEAKFIGVDLSERQV